MSERRVFVGKELSVLEDVVNDFVNSKKGSLEYFKRGVPYREDGYVFMEVEYDEKGYIELPKVK